MLRILDSCSAGRLKKALLTEEAGGQYGVYEQIAQNEAVLSCTCKSKKEAIDAWSVRLFDSFRAIDPSPSHRIMMVQRKISLLTL